jgi:hypothetical protein
LHNFPWLKNPTLPVLKFFGFITIFPQEAPELSAAVSVMLAGGFASLLPPAGVVAVLPPSLFAVTASTAFTAVTAFTLAMFVSSLDLSVGVLIFLTPHHGLHFLPALHFYFDFNFLQRL